MKTVKDGAGWMDGVGPVCFGGEKAPIAVSL